MQGHKRWGKASDNLDEGLSGLTISLEGEGGIGITEIHVTGPGNN